MRGILCGLLLVACGSNDPVASEPASWNTTPGPTPLPLLAFSPVTTLVRLDRPAYAITLDHDNVYFTTAFASSAEERPSVVWQCGKTGCDEATPIASGRGMPTDIAVLGANVYWLGPSESIPKAILSCPVGGCGASDPRLVVFQDPILDIATNGTSLFWLGNGVVSSCDGVSCDASTRVVASQTDAIQISVDDTTLYFRNFTDESIMTCAIADCSTHVHVATDFGFTPFAFDATNVYYRTPAGISRCAKSRCREPFVIAPLDGDANVTDIVADGARVYWINHQTVFTCPISGCANPRVVAPGGLGLRNANRLAIDDHYVYWTAGSPLSAFMTDDHVLRHGPGAIFRVAK